MLKSLMIYMVVAVVAFMAFFIMSERQRPASVRAETPAAPSTKTNESSTAELYAKADASIAKATKSADNLLEKLDQFKKDECTVRVSKYMKGAEEWLKSGETYKAFNLLNSCKGLLEDPKAIALYNRLDLLIPDKEAAKAKSERMAKKKEGVAVGMTKQDALDSIWGKPQYVNTTTTSAGTREQWVYRNNNYLYFENGILTAIQN